MNTETPRRLRLRAAVHITPVDGGLYCVGWQETLKISGSAALGRLWSALFPHLHRGADPEALTAALPPSARGAARRLLDELLDKGFLRDEPASGAVEAPPAHPEHRRTLAFLDSAVDDPAAAFERLRTRPIAVHGTGPMAEAAVRCLVSLGAGRVETDDPTEELRRHAVERGAELGPVPAGPPPVRVHIDLPEPTGPSAAAVGVAGLGDRVVIGPPRRADGDPDLDTALARMRDRGEATDPGPVPEVAATLAGDLAAMQVLYELTGVSTEYDGRAYLVSAERLQTTVHPLWTPGTAVAEPLETDRGAATDPDLIGDLCDPVTGVLPAAEPGDLPQMPLALAVCGAGGFGWSETGDVARYRAALGAARDLAASAPAAELWPVDGGEPREATAPIACVGEDTAAMLCDGLNRLLAEQLADPDERDRRFGPAERDSGEGDLTVELRRPLLAPEVAVAAAWDAGRLLAVYAHPDAPTAREVALRHAGAVTQSGQDRDPVPVVATPPGAPAAAAAPAWDAAATLAKLCAEGERLLAARSRAEPALDALGAVGWIGLDRTGGER